MKNAKISLIVLLMSTLTACSIKVKTDLVCYWHEKIEMEDEAKDWVRESEPPASFGRFLEQVGDDNELHDENC